MNSFDWVQLLGKEYTLDILRATHHPQTVDELSDGLEIPIATTYRRVNTLADEGLLRRVTHGDTDEESGPTAYQRTLDEVQIEFEADSIEVTVEHRHDVYPCLRDLWRGVNDDQDQDGTRTKDYVINASPHGAQSSTTPP